MPNPEDAWFDYNRAADYLKARLPGGFNRRSLERAKAAGDIEWITNARKVWFHKDELDNFVQKKLIMKKAAS